MDDQKQDSRGRPVKCKYCYQKFQLLNEEKIAWKKNKYACPTCGEVYCILPKTERKLRLLQEEYVDSDRKDKKVFNNMISILYDYTKSLIKKHYSNRLKFEDALQYYTHNTVSRFIEYYLKDDSFVVDVSFAGLLMHKIKEAIFNKKEHEIDASSLDFEFEDGNTVEYEDSQKSVIDEIEEIQYKKDLCSQLVELIFAIEKYSKNKHENYTRLVSLASYMRNGNKYFDKFFQMYGNEGKWPTLKTLDAIRDKLTSCEDL